MRTSFIALCFLAACSSSGPALNATLVHVEPRTEAQRGAAAVGRGKERCHLYVDAWNVSAPGCKISITHCEQAGAEEQCMSVADERHVACGGKENICGEDVACDCPRGAARPVEDSPDTVQLRAGQKGPAWKSPGCRAKQVDEFPGAGKAPRSICVLLIHDCDEGQTCEERTTELSCGLRVQECGRTVHCACP